MPQPEDTGGHLATVEPASVVTTQNAQEKMMDLIVRGMSDPTFDANKLEKLLTANERLMAGQAAIDFTEAMTRLMPKLPVIDKRGLITFTDKKGEERRTPFAKYEDIDAAIRPLLIEEGFSISFDTEFQPNGPCIIKGTLSHKGGHAKTVSMPLQMDSSGSKNALQAMGSTFSYGKRYLVTMLLNIITKGEDDDATGHEVIDHDQAVEIDELLRKSGTKRERWMEKTVKVKDVREIKARDYGRAVNSLKAIIHDALVAEGKL